MHGQQQQRLRKLRLAMEQTGFEALWITHDTNRRYLSGFTGTAGSLLITTTDAWLLTDFRYREQAPQQAAGYTVVEHAPVMTDTVGELLVSRGIRKLGFEAQHVSYEEWQKASAVLGGVASSAIELVPAPALVEQLRIVKDEFELSIMQEAALLADQTFEHMLTFIAPGMSEQAVAFEIEMFMRARGAKGTSFETIVASGPRSALPHGIASERVIGQDEFVKLDFGALYKDYCSDITRTVFVGQPTERHRTVYDIVLEAQEAALAVIKPGMTGREVDAVARSVIERHGYGELFGHGTGHGLGMDIHEAPRLSKLSDTVLEPGMVVTVEPGIYIPGFGGVRIEDDVVITVTGGKRLTKASKSFFLLTST